ncbi:MAG: hypothetical protein ACREPM_24945 [Gemmatimonadaceae bacterium]
MASFALLAFASACASSGSSVGGATATSPAPAPTSTVAQFAAQVDSTVAEQVANQVGPGASIRAEYATVSGVRRVVASFHLSNDAYVLVGHIDANGVLRVVFPSEPGDDGFVHGGRDYRTPEFMAGFADEYRFRASQSYRLSSMQPLDSYDGRLGYAFIIASWRPLNVEQFQTDGAWDSFELADDSYLKDPRPAIYEMASLLAGQNREAYTVEFAKYTTTSSLYGGYGTSDYVGSAYGSALRYCAGYGALGWGLNSGVQSMFMPISLGTGYPEGLYSRGQYLFYDDLGDCYRTAYPPNAYPFNYGYHIATGGSTPTNPVPMRGLVPRDRAPVGSNLGARALPVSRLVGATDQGGDLPQASPSYRRRGLITADDGTGEGRGTPTTNGQNEIQNRARPSIQQMVGREPQTTTPGSQAWMRAQAGARASDPGANTNAGNGRRYTPTDNASRGAQSSQPRYQAPQAETRTSAPVNREPATREPAPRPSPPPETRTQSAPPPTPPPASSSTGSSSAPGSAAGSRPPTP